jgi:hypothetical protein
MKGSIGDIRENSNIWGGRQLSKCTSAGTLKLHRKRVVHGKRVNGPMMKRGLPIGPDFTYLSGQGIVKTTSTATVTTYVLLQIDALETLY